MKRLFLALVLPALLVGVANANFLDEFNVPQLDPGWQIGNPDSTHWSLTARPGFLRIMSQYDPQTGNSEKNLFSHFEVISGNFEVSVKLIARPDSAGQVALLVASPDTLHTGPTPAIVGYGNYNFNKIVWGTLNGIGHSLPYSDTLVYLRVRTSGDTVFAEYSPDNSTWTTLNSAWSPPFPGLIVSGVGAANWPEGGGTLQTPAMNADFDWFHLVALTGVEEGNKGFEGSRVQGFKVNPNPFVSFTRVPGHEQECFALYDIAGRKVGNYQGSRIGEGLAPGVYFVRGLTSSSAPLRIVKVR